MAEKTIHKMGNSYSLYLPMEWAKKIASKKVSMRVDSNGNLIVMPLKAVKTAREKELFLDDYDFDLVNRIIILAYRCGFDKFTLAFGKPITTKQILNHKKKFEEHGFPLEIEDLSKTHFTFYFQQPLISPQTIFDNSLNLALNVVRSKQQKENELMEVNFKSLRRNRHVLRRIFISSLIDPSVISEFNVEQKRCFDMDNLLQHICWACELMIKDNISVKDVETTKKIFEIAQAFFSKKEFLDIWKYSSYLKNIENSQLRQELKKAQRYLISSWIV